MRSSALVFRRRLGQPGLVVAPGVYDGLSAKIAERAGFEVIYYSGGAVARGCGVPDLGLLSMTEVVGRLREVVDAVGVPVIADADTGYGNVLNVARAVAEFERAGAAGLHLEDQVTPKRCGHYAGKALVSADAMVAKVRAAVAARRDADMVVIARTDAIAVEGIGSALERGRRYVEAGADAVFVEAPTSREQIEVVADAFDVPLVINMFAGGRTPLVGAGELEALGYRVMLVPSDLQRAAIAGMREAAGVLRVEGTTAGMGERVASFAEREEIVGLDRYQDLATRLGAG